MFDDLYTKITSAIDYRILTLAPLAVSLLMLFVIYTRGVPLGIDFQGGTWMDILLDNNITDQNLVQMQSELQDYGLEDLKVYVGYDMDAKKDKLTVVTTSPVDVVNVSGIIEPYTGRLVEADIARVTLNKKPPVELSEKLESRLKENVKLAYGDNVLTVEALELDEETVESALTYYLGESVDVTLEKKNLNSREVSPTLGKTFKEQGIKALIVAFVLMSIVVFFAFKDFIPSIAVLQAALSDVTIAVGFMSIFRIPLEPASLAALLMLIGYSVDSDILLTTRCLKGRRAEVDENLDDSIKTGLTMTGTVIGAMVVLYIFSSSVVEMPVLKSISQILLFGLIADLFTTWLTNAGIVKWHLERSPHKFKTR
ncbi:MAG: protein translocase subunit SecF [Candidatus Altiarchaeota archaeon]